MAHSTATMERPVAVPVRMPTSQGLTPEQVKFYAEHGFLGPLTLCSPEEMAELRDWIDAEDFQSRPSPVYGTGPRNRLASVGQRDGGGSAKVLRDWHLAYRRMHWLCLHPTVTAAMASIMGPDLLLWRSQFQRKDARGGPIGWHQDLGFPGHRMVPALNPIKNISAWIAIDRADRGNGCVWVIPGSHRMRMERRLLKVKGRYAVEYEVDTSTAVPMVLDPGQYFLFSESTLHGSTHNPSERRRMGISIRVTTPEVRVYEGQDFDGQGYSLEHWGCVQMSGEDQFGYNKIIEPKFVG